MSQSAYRGADHHRQQLDGSGGGQAEGGIAMLTQETLRALLHYDPESGRFTWLVNRGSRARKGNVAGRITTHSGPFYREIIICRRVYQAHRLAFLYLTGAWPIGNVDHWDMNGLNNRSE